MMRSARRLVAVAAMAALVFPAGTTSVVHWIADHDMIDVPYVRDCHGLYRHPEECQAPLRTGPSSALR
jgi:hypothetical protein